MTNPTLIGNVTPYGGFTVESIVERLLASRGMTLDAATGRTIATTTEQTESFNRLRRAMVMMSAKYPGIWTIQEYSVAWIAGDTRINIPLNALNVLYVYFNGVPLTPLNRHMLQGIEASDDSTANYRITGDPRYYAMVGISNSGDANDPIYRQVLELIPAPATTVTDTIRIGYRIRSPELPSSTAEEKDNPLPVHEALQEWLLRRSMELWAADEGDQTTTMIAREERMVVEMDLDELIEGMGEYPKVATAEYPTLPSNRRDDHR